MHHGSEEISAINFRLTTSAQMMAVGWVNHASKTVEFGQRCRVLPGRATCAYPKSTLIL